MKKLKIIFLLILLSCKAAFAEEMKLTRNDFKFQAKINSKFTKNGLYQVHINKEIIRKSEKELQDTRIFDSKDNQVPYVILPNQIPKEQEKSFNLKIIEYFQENNSDIVIAKMPDKYSPVNFLELAIDDINFKKNILLFGSNDKKSWSKLQKGAIYDFTSSVPLRKTEIEFKKSNFPYYKIELINETNTKPNSESFQLQYQELNLNLTKSFNRDLRINNIVALSRTGKDDVIKYDQAEFNKLTLTADEKRNSEIVIPAELPVDKLFFSINNPYYSRQVEIFSSETGKKDSFQLLKSDNIFKISLADINDKKEYIDLSTNKHNFYKFVIINRDNDPLDISKINFSWVRKDLYFIARNDNEDYQLFIGNKYVEQPYYDFVNFLTAENWYLQKFIPVEAANPEQNPQYKDTLSPEEKNKMQKMGLIAIVSFIVLLLGIWIYKLAKEAGAKTA
jgi:hypothetical protein